MTLQFQHDREFSTDLAAELAEVYLSLPHDDRSLFNDPYFLRECWWAFGPGSQPLLLVARSGGKLVGAAAFKSEPVRLAGATVRCLTPIAYRVSDFTDFLVANRNREAFLVGLMRELAGLGQYAMLPNVTRRDADVLSRCGGRLTAYGQVVNPICRDEDRRFQAIVSKKRNRYYTNRLKRMGELTVRHSTSGVSGKTLEQYFELHKERWAFDGIESKFTQPDMAQVYQRLCSGELPAAEAGNRVVFTEVRLDDTPVGLSTSYRWGKRLLYHVPTFNLEFSDFSPGQVLLREMFIYAIDQGLDCLDLGYGEESYKARFSSDALTYHTFVMTPGTLSRVALRARKAVAGFVRKRRAVGTERSAAPTPHELTVFCGSGPAGATSPAVIEMDFAQYVRYARCDPSPPAGLTCQTYRRFRQGGRLAAMMEAERLAAGVWTQQGAKGALPVWDVCLEGADESAVWLYEPVGPRDQVGVLLSAILSSQADQPVFAVAESSDQDSRQVFLSAGFKPCATVTRSGRGTCVESLGDGCPSIRVAEPNEGASDD